MAVNVRAVSGMSISPRVVQIVRYSVTRHMGLTATFRKPHIGCNYSRFGAVTPGTISVTSFCRRALMRVHTESTCVNVFQMANALLPEVNLQTQL